MKLGSFFFLSLFLVEIWEEESEILEKKKTFFVDFKKDECWNRTNDSVI